MIDGPGYDDAREYIRARMEALPDRVRMTVHILSDFNCARLYAAEIDRDGGEQAEQAMRVNILRLASLARLTEAELQQALDTLMTLMQGTDMLVDDADNAIHSVSDAAELLARFTGKKP